MTASMLVLPCYDADEAQEFAGELAKRGIAVEAVYGRHVVVPVSGVTSAWEMVGLAVELGCASERRVTMAAAEFEADALQERERQA